MPFAYRQPVTDMLLPRVATTLSLALYAKLIVLVWGIMLGSLGGMSNACIQW
jgi:ABC-type dipeptide/oligopeptide/nickel transport system permease component